MFTMKEACLKTNLKYETLKFYCNEGLVPNVKRDKNNRRIFNEHDINWINDLNCLRRCGMSIQEMKEYLALCLEGPSTIDERKVILKKKRLELLEEMEKIQNSLDYIEWKENFYQEVQEGKRPYISNLISYDDKFQN